MSPLGAILPPLPGVINEVYAPLAGDVDNCADVSLQWALEVIGYGDIPTIPEIRAAAHVPDTEHRREGMQPENILAAARILVPATHPVMIRGDFEGFVHELGPGTAAVVFVRSSALPWSHQYGFGGLHALGAARRGVVLFEANPLAPRGSAPRAIGDRALERAMRAFPRGPVAVVLHRVEGDPMLKFNAERHRIAAGSPFFASPGGRRVGAFSRDATIGTIGYPMDESPDQVDYAWRLALVRSGAVDHVQGDKLVWVRRSDLTPVPSDPAMDAGIRAFLTGADPTEAAVNAALNAIAEAIEEARP